MADKNYINSSFVQKDSVCVTSCYATVLEYFSDNSINIQAFLDRYDVHYNLIYFSSGSNKVKNQQRAISDHFHAYCRQRNLRGFEFIHEIHNSNTFETNSHCVIVASKAYLHRISDDEIITIRKELVENDALAMVLYKVPNGSMHAIVVGYDSDLKEYFFKDPEIRNVQKGDILSQIEVWEFIIFNEPIDYLDNMSL